MPVIAAVECHGYPSIKNIERAKKILIWIFFHVGNYAAVELIYVFEAGLQQKSGRFFAPYAAGADGYHGFIF